MILGTKVITSNSFNECTHVHTEREREGGRDEREERDRGREERGGGGERKGERGREEKSPIPFIQPAMEHHYTKNQNGTQIITTCHS